MSENLSRYFEGTGSPSVFDSLLGSGVAHPATDVTIPENSAAEAAVPDSTRDLWMRNDPETVSMMTSPGILSTNDLVQR